jgi:hypothetical protein
LHPQMNFAFPDQPADTTNWVFTPDLSKPLKKTCTIRINHLNLPP